MLGSEQVMAVMLEEDDLRLVHRDWPQKMRLAVCLMPSGDCQLLLFRQEETAIFSSRLRKHLGLRAEELCIHPPVHGFPTRQLRYSDQRSLAALLADSPQLVEDATDYSVNFAFALEEGLDPVEFLGVEAAEEDLPALAAAPELPMQDSGALQFASRRAPIALNEPKPAARKLTLDLAREAARIEEEEQPTAPAMSTPSHGLSIYPGEAFKPVSDFEDDVSEGGYTLREDRSDFVISNGAGTVVQIENASQLFLRDDRQLLAIRIDNRATTRPGTLRIKSSLLPKSLAQALRSGFGPVEVALDGPFVYVTLPAARDHAVELSDQVIVERSAPTSEKRTKKPSRGRGALRLFALTSLTIVAIFVILGMEPIDAIKQNAENGPIDWSQFRLSLQSNP